jgi:phage I-like protein
MRATLTIELLAKDGQPPAEFRIFASGFIETTKGVFKFDDKSADAVMEKVADWGNDYCIDYGHSMLSFFQLDPAESMKAAGWFTPELRDGELWASNVSWTKKASEMLSEREARYISPAFDFDADGRVTELVNCALTNIPATKNQIPLVASREGGDRKYNPKERKMSKKNRVNAFVLYKLGLPPDADDTQVMAALDGLRDASRSAEATRARLEKDEREKKEREEKARKEREGDPDLATLVGKGAVETATAEKSRVDSEKQLVELTGAKSYGEALGVVLSWKNQVPEIATLQARIAELEQKGQGATAEVLVEQGIRDGKISPAQKEMWLSIGKKNPDMLKGFLQTASPVVPKKSAIQPENKARVALTAEQTKAAAKMGITKPEDLQKLSEQMAEVQALRAGAA